ncbi:IPT/TIG domain-containing protein [Pontibacter mangrovi]|uniref:T9SS type A sorting domain-containing protein n=1 Tax=Pontibacter mangrovi TaxID=2589816 RepID=A0A501WE62_9BACT|nr:IPT/TIG domain-containing protein [Pontibacter mangrovi]TPE45461.1 T9SS type A sorting domain-containing protein [Pontibacter mangrovi]
MVNLYAFVPASMRAVLLLLLTLVSSHVLASGNPHMIPIPLQERVQQAAYVVEGEVVRQESFWDARHENIYTSNIIKVYKSFKGEVQAEEIEVITEGGTVGLQKHVFSTALKLRPGQQGMFFLAQQQLVQRSPGNMPLSARAYGSEQGFVQYDTQRKTAHGVFDTYPSVQELYNRVTERTGRKFRVVAANQKLQATAVQEGQKREQGVAAVPLITSFTPTTGSAGTGAILTINGTGFGSSRGNGSVEFLNADDGGQTYIKPLASEYISWSDRRITMYIPSVSEDEGTPGAGPIRVTNDSGESTISATSLQITYAYSNIGFEGEAFKPILTGPNGEGGYSILFAESMDDRLAAKEGFRRAVNSWVCVSGINWVLGGPTSIDASKEDKASVIRFASQSVVGESVLARTISRYQGCGNETDTIFWVTEFDMEINNAIQWQYGPGGPNPEQFDFETVMLHELGHAHQLGHVNISRAVMFYAIEYAQLERDLSPLDIEGANLVMANSVAQGATLDDYRCRMPEPMVPSSSSECDLAPEILTLEARFSNTSTVQVNWVTRGEENIADFVVQRSHDGIEWEDVATVPAEGPGNGQDLEYAYADNNPLRGQSYYRLEVVYRGGDLSYSPRVVVVNPSDLQVFRYYPNPVGGDDTQLTVSYLVSRRTTMQAKLYNTKGQLVRNYELEFSSGSSDYVLDLGDLPSGMYLLKWEESNKSGTERILRL